MNIRLATATDLEGIRTVGKCCWPATYHAIAPPGYVEDGLHQWWSAEFISAAIDGQQSFMLVAETAHEIVGTAHFALLAPEQAVMWKFYVLPSWQGNGVGRQLFDAGLALLPNTVITIFTEYLSTNHRAATVYASLGFHFDRDVHEDFQGHPLTYTWVKRLR